MNINQQPDNEKPLKTIGLSITLVLIKRSLLLKQRH